MIDRDARKKLVAALDAYMNEQTSSGQLQDILDGITTEDPTVQGVAEQLGFHVDYFREHKIVASKEEWDYFNRLRLLLQSDGEMKTRFRWHWRQGAAFLALTAFIGYIIVTGWGRHLLFAMIPLGLVSLLLTWLRFPVHVDKSLYPFPSIACLLKLRRRVKDFARRRYPAELAQRRIRPRREEIVTAIPYILLCLLLSPLVLAIHMLPTIEWQGKIDIPEATGAEEKVLHSGVTL